MTADPKPRLIKLMDGGKPGRPDTGRLTPAERMRQRRKREREEREEKAKRERNPAC